LRDILAYDASLELMDPKGETAVFRRRQKVRSPRVRDNVIAFQDYAWGDCEILAEYRCSPGVVVDRYREGDHWNGLISLRETKSAVNIQDFHTTRTIKTGFTWCPIKVVLINYIKPTWARSLVCSPEGTCGQNHRERVPGRRGVAGRNPAPGRWFQMRIAPLAPGRGACGLRRTPGRSAAGTGDALTGVRLFAEVFGSAGHANTGHGLRTLANHIGGVTWPDPYRMLAALPWCLDGQGPRAALCGSTCTWLVYTGRVGLYGPTRSRYWRCDEGNQAAGETITVL
jgi:hypothetical protein